MMGKWKIKEVGMADIIGTEVNANKMTAAEFDKLVSNIRKSGLSSLIACYEGEDHKYHIISGNHRYAACKKLGYSKINIIYTEEANLTRDEIIALQLSHNSLHGSDDKSILKTLLDEISSIDFKEFAHINMNDLEQDDVFNASIIPASEHYRVGMILYKQDLRLLDDLLEIQMQDAALNDLVIMVNGDQVEDEFLDMISKAKKEFNIKSTSIAFSKILELAKRGLEHEHGKE